jgi:hypothetical protein
METRRWLVPAFLSLALGSAPASRAAPGTAALKMAPSTITVPIEGTVSGQPESVRFTGTARISVQPTSIRIAGARRKVIVSIDLNGLTGKGLSTGATYSAATEANLTRSFAASDVIEVTFPFFRGNPADAQARTGIATFTLDYDVSTGALTAVKVSLAGTGLPG